MAKFDDPETAFDHSGQKLKAGTGWIHLYRLSSALRGFEMVVASSNNRAVENVSAELPGIRAIAEDATELRYFTSLSDALHEADTWGMIAVVLGNARNRGQFRQVFWWDGERGLNGYLRTAAGTPYQLQVIDPMTGESVSRPPQIVIDEQPPSSRQEALRRWGQARKRFLDALRKSRTSQAELDGLQSDLSQLPSLAQAETLAAGRREAAVEARERIRFSELEAKVVEDNASYQLQSCDDQLSAHRLKRPGFWARLFRTRIAREWSDELDSLQDDRTGARALYDKASADVRRIKNLEGAAGLERTDAENAFRAAHDRHQESRRRLAEASGRGVVLPDDDFFAQDHGRRHRATPWFLPAAQRTRDEVFIAAMALHRAFIDAAARPLRHNLGALMNAFAAQGLPGAEKQALVPHLWSSLFLVVPLVSTTFASVNRMLGKLPPESLGWLLVDEAGQAAPQAAVGALMRARRALIVGDPAQIEPVVLLPASLTHAIFRRLGADPERYAAPVASIQTLADAASAYSSEFETSFGSRSVGVPLLVHRRCSEPMFSISNSIAYSGLMVLAKSPRPSPIRDALGPSVWIHVEGSGEDKWCREEGEQVVSLLQDLARAGADLDLYIISPFVIVADRLRQAVLNSGVLGSWPNINPRTWVRERIGTVHTAQGREAEAVILVLGAPYPAQTGARSWAGGRPNLLNVAVSRAKEVLYVVGNRRLWRGAGIFRELDARLP